MGGVRLARVGVLHHLDIAVIGGQQHHAARLLQRRDQATDADVDRIHRLDGGAHDAGMAHHVGIGIVADDQVVLTT